MNKDGLIKAISKDTGYTQKDVAVVVDSMCNVIMNTVKTDPISIVGFGKFTCKQFEARDGRNPQTGETIKIPAYNSPMFKAGTTFKAIVR